MYAAKLSKCVPNSRKSAMRFVLNLVMSCAFCFEKRMNTVKHITFDTHFLIFAWVSTRMPKSIQNWLTFAIYPLFTHELVWCPFFCVSPGAFLLELRFAHGFLLLCCFPRGFCFEMESRPRAKKSPMGLNLEFQTPLGGYGILWGVLL